MPSRDDESPRVLAIDLGTGGPKAAVVSASGDIVAWASRALPTTFTPDGGAEQDPQQMWDTSVSAAREAVDRSGDGGLIGCVAITSQYMSTVPVAADGLPVGQCLTWMDSRGGVYNRRLLKDDSFVTWIERHGMIPLPSGNDGLAHIQFWRDRQPDVHEAARAFVEPMDYLTARLTGRVCATQSTAFSLLTVDNRTWGATVYDDELVDAAGIDPARLPPLVPMGEPIGGVTAEAATALGIRAGTTVTPGTIDSITAAVGAGAIRSAVGGVIVGTTSVLVTHVTQQRGDLGSGLLTVPSPLPGRWYVMAENGVGGSALEWFVRTIASPDAITDDAPATGDGGATSSTAIERVLEAAAAMPSGSGGVAFMPWMLGSIAPRPNDEVRGAFVGLHLRHGRAHLARSVLEGVAANLAWLAPHVEEFAETRFPNVRFGGGGAMSPLWAQILADALARPVHRLAEPRLTNARGAAFLAMMQIGVLRETGLDALVRVAAVHDPDPTGAEVMAEVTRRLCALHPALSGFATPAGS